MKFASPLIEGRLIKRYKRFFVDVELPDGTVVTAHSVNTGRMTGVLDAGNRVWLSPANNPARKLKYTWEVVEADDCPIGINTSKANHLVEEAIQNNVITELSGYDSLRREVKYGTNSRIDFLLEKEGQPPCYVEVKNVHMKRDTLAEFPDAPSERATKHMAELALLAEEGIRAVVLFVIQRNDCTGVSPAADIDPAYATAFKAACTKGVEAYGYSCYVAPDEIRLEKALPVYGMN